MAVNSNRVHVQFTPEILEQIDAECARTGDNRSNLVRRAVLVYLNSQRMLDQMPDLIAVTREAIKANKDLQLSGQMHLADLPGQK